MLAACPPCSSMNRSPVFPSFYVSRQVFPRIFPPKFAVVVKIPYLCKKSKLCEIQKNDPIAISKTRWILQKPKALLKDLARGVLKVTPKVVPKALLKVVPKVVPKPL